MSKKWTNEQQAIFLKRTGELLVRGYTLAEAIESLTYYLPASKKNELAQCLLQLREGYPLHQILTNLRFNSSLIGYVYFAEQHGGLAEAFQDGSTFVLKRSQDMKRMMKMFYYPIFLIFITGVLFVFVDQILLPKFTSLFQSMELKPNFFTKVIYQVGDILPLLLSVGIVLVFLLLLYFLFIYRRQTLLVRRRTLVRLPVVGSFFKLFYTHYFSIQLSYLLAAGLSVLEALQLFEKNPQQPFYAQISTEIKKKLSKGEKLESILTELDLFEKDLTHIVKHGLEKGKLSQELSFYSKHCVAILEEKTEKSLKLIQPILYVLIASLIISMYLAILLPMFHLLDGI
jgi:competence protein ComGB